MPHPDIILVVDDELPILDVYKNYLCPNLEKDIIRSSRRQSSSMGNPSVEQLYTLILASSGEDAVRMVEEEMKSGRRITAGFFDMKMPGGIDGLETIERVRALDHDILCAIVTAYQDRTIDEINKHFGDGHEDEWDYINKPFTENEIRQKARNLVSSWHRRRREENQQKNLEQLIQHLSGMRNISYNDMLLAFSDILKKLIEFTESHGGMLVRINSGKESEKLLSVGTFAQEEKSTNVLKQALLREYMDNAIASVASCTLQDILVIPLVGAQGPHIVVVLDKAVMSEDKRKLVDIFAKNASAALDNLYLYNELRSFNENLEQKVSDRTAQLTEMNTRLEEKTTELEQMLQSLRETEKQLMHQEKLAAIGQLAAGVAHEINNPSAFVLMNLDTLDEWKNDFDSYFSQLDAGASLEELTEWRHNNPTFDSMRGEVHQMIDEMREGINRIVRIVKDLRVYSRSENEKPSKFIVENVLEDVFHILRNEIAHRARIIKKFEGNLELVGDKGRLVQVFINLIMNAMDAMDQAGVAEKTIEITTCKNNDDIVIAFNDSGTGIPQDKIDDIFLPFFTTKPAGVGTGLGLSISKNIIAQHGGTIQARNNEKGALFVITLPKQSQILEQHQIRENLFAAPVLRKLRLLLIDDDVRVLKAQQRLLARKHEPDIVSSGREALAKLAQSGNAYDAILCDLMMPEMSGIEVFKSITQQFPQFKDRIVFVSGGAFTNEARDFLENYKPKLLEKPISLQSVETYLQEVS